MAATFNELLQVFSTKPGLPDFVEEHKPQLVSLPTSRAHLDRTLFEFYLSNNFWPIYQDMQGRPEHYTEEEKALLNSLALGKKVEDVDKRLMNDLFLTYQRPTELARHTGQALKRIQQYDENGLLPGEALSEADVANQEANFENQKFDGTIEVL